MKKINKIQILLILLLGITFTSCETTDLDLLDDPNNVTLDKADLDRYLVAIQLDFADFVQFMGTNGAQLTRIEYMFGRTYEANYSAVFTNTEWNLAYQGMFSDIKGAEQLAVQFEQNKHLGVMKVMQAFTLMTLVDMYGDVPYSEATNPSEFPFPHADSGASVYAAAIDLLDQAIVNLNQDGDNLTNDFFYDNDFSSWIRVANTMKMRAYLNTRLVDASATGKFNAIVSSGNFISNTDNDFQFTYGTNNVDPDVRHPGYASDYNVSGAGGYRSNWLMDLMVTSNDPRRFSYFLRQVPCTPGAGTCPPSGPQLQCSQQSAPQHYPSTMIFCSVENGYWGRDHGNDEGIPPDSFRRTGRGSYPAGGGYDFGTNRDGTIELQGDGTYAFEYDNSNDALGLERGLLGAGITPIILASNVDFWRAEMALSNGSAGTAASFVRAGMEKSIAKVDAFLGTSDPGYDANLLLDDTEFDSATGTITNPSTSGGLQPTNAEISDFVNSQVGLITDTSDSSWNALSNQLFVNGYGNGLDAYNFYRRTGFPKTLQFNIESASGNFVRSFFYAASEANTNNNIIQKETVDVPVFWDNNPPSPGFPFAN